MNPYDGNINPAKIIERMGKANQFLKYKVSTRTLQSSAPEETDRFDWGLQALKWCKCTEGDKQIKRDGVTENTQTN